MALNLGNLLNDYNGAVFLQPGTAEWGFVEAQWYLQIPTGVNYPGFVPAIAGTSPFGGHLHRENFLKANYATLVQPNALGQADKALFGTMLRLHVATLGTIDNDLARRGVIEDEYAVHAPLNANYGDAANDIPAHPQSASIARYVKKFGDTFIHMMTYVFSARGHHWQDEYDALYDRLFAACGVTRPTTWVLPSNRELFRQILHCFGVRLPLAATTWCQNNNRMANPMRIRFVPHAPVAGAAQITTMQAVLTEMQSEAWWGTFLAKFQVPIGQIAAEVTTIAANPYEYHVASRVITGNPKRDLSANSIAAFKSLVQFALGYIDHLGRRHSLHGQKVLTQKSGGPKALADAFARACDTLGKPAVNVANMATFINAL